MPEGHSLKLQIANLGDIRSEIVECVHCWLQNCHECRLCARRWQFLSQIKPQIYVLEMSDKGLRTESTWTGISFGHYLQRNDKETNFVVSARVSFLTLLFRTAAAGSAIILSLITCVLALNCVMWELHFYQRHGNHFRSLIAFTCI